MTIVEATGVPPAGTVIGSMAMLWQTVRYSFDSSKVYPNRAGLFRIVSDAASADTNELIAPFSWTARFSYFTNPAQANDTATNTVPGNLNTVRGLKILPRRRGGGYGAGLHRTEEVAAHDRSLLQELEDPMSHLGHDSVREQSRAREGFALPLAIMVLALLSIGLVAGFAMSTSEQAATSSQRSQARAYSYAQSGLEAFLTQRKEFRAGLRRLPRRTRRRKPRRAASARSAGW